MAEKPILRKPGNEIQDFINGDLDRFGNIVENKYFVDAVQNSQDEPPKAPEEFLSSLFDETVLDPYELSQAKVNLENKTKKPDPFPIPEEVKK